MLRTGERFRNVRLALGLTRAQFAESIGISPSHLSRIENMEREPSIRLRRLVQTVHHVQEWWLADGGDYDPIFVRPDGTTYKKPIGDSTDGAGLHDGKERLRAMIEYLEEVWSQGDLDLQGWLFIQFRRAFPDFIYGRDKATDRDEPSRP